MIAGNDFSGFYRDRAVMITGGVGFLGSNLAHRLVELGANVLLVDSLVPDYGGNLFNVAELQGRLRVNVADIRDENSMDYLVRGQELISTWLVRSVTSIVCAILHRSGDQLPSPAVAPRGLPQVQSFRQVVYASTRQIYGSPSITRGRDAPQAADRRERNQQDAGEWYHILYNNVHGVGRLPSVSRTLTARVS